jgi:hypothetical protein
MVQRLVIVLALAFSLSAILALGRPHRPAQAGPVIIAGPWFGSPDMTIHDVASPPGVLTVAADGFIPDQGRHLRVWWTLEVRSADNKTTFFKRDYKSQAFDVQAGGSAPSQFREQLPFMPGQYNITLELHEGTPQLGPGGAVSVDHSVLRGSSRSYIVQ